MEEVVSDSGGREREIQFNSFAAFFLFSGLFSLLCAEEEQRGCDRSRELEKAWRERERASQGQWASKKKPSIVDQGGRENRKKNRRTGTADMLSTLLGHCCLDGL